jgi:hypothetical protein
MKPKVGFMGLGIMGSAMAANVQRAGFPLMVYNRAAAKADPWAERGVGVATSPRSLAQATPRRLRERRSAIFSASAPRRCCMPGLRRASLWPPCLPATASGIFWWRVNPAGGSPVPGRIGNASPIKNPCI